MEGTFRFDETLISQTRVGRVWREVVDARKNHRSEARHTPPHQAACSAEIVFVLLGFLCVPVFLVFLCLWFASFLLFCVLVCVLREFLGVGFGRVFSRGWGGEGGC